MRTTAQAPVRDRALPSTLVPSGPESSSAMKAFARAAVAVLVVALILGLNLLEFALLALAIVTALLYAAPYTAR
jgi:hypothetical protein